ncbi:MAG: alpha/beta fold hydrolase [Clostridiales bacterium]|nr:alpha/beta fold hydrolase [Clostridiales bacterium]
MNLKTAFDSRFKIGAAISRMNLECRGNMKFLLDQFNSFTAENDMKPMFFLDTEENLNDPKKYDLEPCLCFDFAVPYLEFSRKNNIPMRGHTLLWHNQTPKWFFYNDYDEGKGLVDRDKMLIRLENYIKGVLTFVQENYPGQIYAWDVCNEIIDEGDFRKSLWLKVVGEDFFIKAFEFARKYASPEVKLFYNDYNTYEEWKRDLILEKVLKPLIKKGLVDGMGMQSHLLMNEPELSLYEKALHMYGALGIEVHVTELDIHNADHSEESMNKLAERYKELFTILVKAKDEGKANVTSVTFWNLLDQFSWLTGFRKERSHPLLFEGKCEAKKAYYSVLETVVDKDKIDKWVPPYSDDELRMITPLDYFRDMQKLMYHRLNIEPGLDLYYEEFGFGDNYILSAQVGFYPFGMQQHLARMGYHVICITLRGFYPSSYVTEDYGDRWYDIFAKDVVTVADKLHIDKFVYMGASHGAGVGWHLMLNNPERVTGFIACVPGPHSIDEGAMSIRQMLLSGIIKEAPPMDPPIDNDPLREERRNFRAMHISHNLEPDPREKAIDYGRPLMKYKNEEKLREMLHTIQVPTLILGATDDPISTPELMLRAAKELPHCKMIMYSNTGHNIDTDLVEELSDEADRFIKQVQKDGRVYRINDQMPRI